MPPRVSDVNRFNIPVMEFLTAVVSEAIPDLNVSEGSVVHDVVIRPNSLMMQPLRDYTRLIMRNATVRNFQVMDEDELDGLAANFTITRRDGVKARGVQRVFFRNPQAVQIPADARFYDDSGRSFAPISAISVTQSQLEAQVLTSTGEYYVDVPAVAIVEGEESMVGAGTIRRVQGIVGATRTTNPASFTSGRNRESNTELYRRILGSVTNQDLVKRSAIERAILETFESVRQVEVVGFGDKDMTRDTVSVVLALQELFQRSFCQKINIPLDSNGNIKFVEDDGVTVIQTPVGGFVGGIVDNLGLDFLAMSVTLDGLAFETVAVQPGFKIRLFGSDSADPDVGDYTVTRVVDGPIAPGGQDYRIVLLDRPFGSTTQPGDADDHFPYTILGAVSSSLFHIGGKVDVYIDSVATEEREVIISTAIADSAGVIEIPLTAAALLPNGNSLFENNEGFESPVLSVAKVEEIDAVAADVVLRTLTPDTHYVTVRAEKRGRYTQAEEDVLIIRGRDDNDVPLFDGSRLKVTYLTNADFATIQTYLNDPANRDATKDIRAKEPEIVYLDVDLDYRGTASLDEVRDIITEFIAEKSFRPTVSVNEIVSTLAFFGVTDIVMPITITSRLDQGNGDVTVTSSQDRLSAGRVQIFRAVPDLSIRKLG